MLDRAPLTSLRYLGFAGSLALAAGAYQVGALPGRADGDGLPGMAQLPGLLACLAGLVALTVAWWRIGRISSPAAPLPGRWVLVTAALWMVPLLFAPPLASRDVYAYACQGAVAAAGQDPSVTSPAALPCSWLTSVPAIWRDAASPYGPLATLVSHGADEWSGGRIAVAVGLFRAVALIGLALCLRYGRRLALACGVAPSRAAWLALACPLVAVHVVSGAHHDALMTGLVMAGLAAAVARRGVLAGILVGCAAAVKLTAVVALPFALLPLAAASLARTPLPDAVWRRLLRAVLLVCLPAVAGYAALTAAAGTGAGLLRALGHTGDLVQWTSPPTALGMAVGYVLRAAGVDDGYPTAVAVARLIALGVLVAVVALVWWRAWRRVERTPTAAAPAAVGGAGLAFVAVTVLGPVFFPWYALTPLALLAVSTVDERVRAWLAATVGALAFLILPNGAGLAPRTKLPGALLVTAALLAAAAMRVKAAVAVSAVRTRRQKPSA